MVNVYWCHFCGFGGQTQASFLPMVPGRDPAIKRGQGSQKSTASLALGPGFTSAHAGLRLRLPPPVQILALAPPTALERTLGSSSLRHFRLLWSQPLGT